MKTILHKADQRGHANHGWLDSYHSFSFAGFYDPAKVHFGALRVLNDDSVKAGFGFPKHPHDNMEIVSIPVIRGPGTSRQYRPARDHQAERCTNHERRQRHYPVK